MRSFSGIFVFALTAILTLAIIKTLNISLPISVTTRNVSSELSVVGEGKVDVVPDTANIQAGISAQGTTIKDVENKINAVNNKIIEAVSKIGVPKKDIKTSNYSINPNYDFTPNGRENISGYMGNTNLNITVREQDLIAKVITAATEGGANQVFNSGFTVEDPSKYREQARNKAIQNAREQAKKLSSELGIKLGKVVNIVESQPGEAFPLMRKDAGLGGAIQPELEPGTQTVTSVVTLFFEKR